MRRAAHYLLASNLLLGALFFAGCETVPQGIQQARIEMAQHIAADRRLLYRAALLQTGLQILGLRSQAGPAMEHSGVGDAQ
jgi:starvation-inducible outer membrane lipoprotein